MLRLSSRNVAHELSVWTWDSGKTRIDVATEEMERNGQRGVRDDVHLGQDCIKLRENRGRRRDLGHQMLRSMK